MKQFDMDYRAHYIRCSPQASATWVATKQAFRKALKLWDLLVRREMLLWRFYSCLILFLVHIVVTDTRATTVNDGGWHAAAIAI